MRKNVAGQVVGVQMVSASDGSAFTGAVTVYVTGDAGTQAVGSVGSGACTHEGNGFHTYAPSQAETNFNHVAFTFVGTGAVPATVQIYTESIDRHDTADLGLTNLDAAISTRASASALTSVDTAVQAILIDTDELQSDWTNGGRLDLILDARASQTSVDTGFTDIKGATFSSATDSLEAIRDRGDAAWITAVVPTTAAIADAVWDEALSGHATAGSTGEALSAAGGSGDPWITALPGSYTAGQAGYILGTNLDATVGTRATQVSVDAVPTATENADELLKRDWTAITGEAARSVLNALRFLRNKWTLSGTTLTVTKENDTTTAWTGVVTTNAAAEPVTGNDPD